MPLEQAEMLPFADAGNRLLHMMFLFPLKTLLPFLLNSLPSCPKGYSIADSHQIPCLSSPLSWDPFEQDQITWFHKVKLLLLCPPAPPKPDLDYLPCASSSSDRFSSSHTEVPDKCWALILLPLTPLCFNSSPCGAWQQSLHIHTGSFPQVQLF